MDKNTYIYYASISYFSSYDKHVTYPPLKRLYFPLLMLISHYNGTVISNFCSTTLISLVSQGQTPIFG